MVCDGIPRRGILPSALSPVGSLHLLLASIVLLSCSPAGADVVINEVLYDPDGPDTGLEFVELLNCGRVGVSLSGWTLETGNGANPDDWTVEWIGGDFDYLEPGAFLLVGESDVVPAPDYETALDLQNGPDAARLTDGASVVDVVGWGEPLFQGYYEGSPASDVPSGSSLARAPDCYDHDDNSLDLLASPIPTPGSRNSPELDLSLSAIHSGASVIDAGSTVKLRFRVENEGTLPVVGGTSIVSVFLDGSASADAERVVVDSLAPRDTIDVTIDCGRRDGYHRALARVEAPGDCEAGNDEAATSFTVGHSGGLLKLNEIMFSPREGSTEWLELENASGGSLDLAGWFLGDEEEQFEIVGRCATSGARQAEVAGRLPAVRAETSIDEALTEYAAVAGYVELSEPERRGLVPPGGYVVVAKDTSRLPEALPCPALEPERWEALSADDTVVLLDEFRTPMETVTYEDAWGGDRGISLERVRTDVAADVVTNWGGSVDPTGSTPCRPNSIYLPPSSGEGRLSASPNPFTPNGDGDGDRVAISYDLPVARSTVRLSVFDVRGRRRAILADHVATASEGDVLWDGADENGRILPSGMYVIRLEAIAPREGVLVDEKLAVGLVR
ncbi:MAG: hypothetical protein GF400_09080 [Candidatus Eisenbacteria bacterium]|nr:hypothetical protein [Candidatus Eisenbacteria bacterium]